MKRWLAFVLCIAFLSMVPGIAVAETITESDSKYAPDVEEVCNGLPYHKMISRGTGHVYLSDGTLYISYGACWQCSGCYLVMVTEGDIYYPSGMSTIGRWATLQCYEPISANGAIISPPSSYGYCGSSSMSGFKFFLS